MKPEELDQLFREKLEALEEVPGMALNQESAWRKIASKLNGGWTLFGTVLILIVSMAIILYFLLPARHTAKDFKDTSSEKRAQVVDTIAPEITPIPNSLKKHQKSASIHKKIAHHVAAAVAELVPDKVQPLSQDTLSPDTLEKKASSLFLIRRFKMMHSDLARPELDFSLPPSQFLQMKVSNELNLKNLIQSFKAQQSSDGNLYYHYEYNNNHRFPLDNIVPKYSNGNTIHLSNINRQK